MTLQATTTTPIGINDIIELVCARFGIARNEIDGRKVTRRNAKYRFIVFAMMQKHTGLTCAKISRHFNIDHTSVMYGLTHYTSVMREHDLWRADIHYIESTLDSGIEQVVGEIASMRQPAKPVVVKPKPVEQKSWRVLREPVGYRASIPKCEATSEPARINHQLMWSNYAEWKLRNPLDWFKSKATVAA